MEKLVWNSEIAAPVLGKGVEFVPIPLSEPAPASLQLSKVRGYAYCSVMGCHTMTNPVGL